MKTILELWAAHNGCKYDPNFKVQHPTWGTMYLVPRYIIESRTQIAGSIQSTDEAATGECFISDQPIYQVVPK